MKTASDSRYTKQGHAPKEAAISSPASYRSVPDRLDECARILRDKVTELRALARQRSERAAVEIWLLDNHSYVQFQIREARRSLPLSYVRKLPRLPERGGETRVYRITADLVAATTGAIDTDAMAHFATRLKHDHPLILAELWAFGPMLRLVLAERLVAVIQEGLENEEAVATVVQSFHNLESVSWREFVESVSSLEEILRRDPAGVYPQMDFPTRDSYRHAAEQIAKLARKPEDEVAKLALAMAQTACSDGTSDESPRFVDQRKHVGYYLVGNGKKDFRNAAGCRITLRSAFALFGRAYVQPLYFGFVAIVTALLLAGFLWLFGFHEWWILAVLLIPASQAALEIANLVASRLVVPKVLPTMDFSDGIPEDCQTMVVVPTLLLSAANAEKLLGDLEIRYLANRDVNLYFALLTDYADAAGPHTDKDEPVLEVCSQGVQRLNARYGRGDSGPFFLFHRPRHWNPQEGSWMGYERKRGKLNDFNDVLMGHSNRFEIIVGDMSVLLRIRYVITLDTDSQLPRDTARKMVASMAHPLNRPVLDPKTNTVTSGYAVIQPRVSVSMESSGRSRLAQIFSGQTGFDPYSTAVSDVYQDLFGRASFTGKGIYDLWAFETAVGKRFPENAILSHDLIEGEHARTGLLTSVEVIDDYPTTYQAFSKRKHRWVRGDWQIMPWLFSKVPGPNRERYGNPLPLLSRWKILDNLRRSLYEIFFFLALIAGWFILPSPGLWTVAVFALMLLPTYADMILTIVRAPERRLLSSFITNLATRLVLSHRDAALNLLFIPHQALMMCDSIIRTLVRQRSRRKMLEWETMAQSELAGVKVSMVEKYLTISAGFALVLLGLLSWYSPVFNLAIALSALWVATPVIVSWLNAPPAKPAALSEGDRGFLRDTALRTWRFFRDYSTPESNWLAPDNVQQDPPLVANQISPTNLGLLLTASLSAHDFGYLTQDELGTRLNRIFETMTRMERYRGNFYNWYNTLTLSPMPPVFVSTVDSGNLASSLCTVRQGCLEILKKPLITDDALAGLHDHTVHLREMLPNGSKNIAVMRLIAALLHQLESKPLDLFFWEGILTEAQETTRHIAEKMEMICWQLEQQEDRHRAGELRYWQKALSERVDAAVVQLGRLAPWLATPLEPEFRVNMRDASLAPIFVELGRVHDLGGLPDAYDRIENLIHERLEGATPLYSKLRWTLEELLVRRLPDARVYAGELNQSLTMAAAQAQSFFEEMEFAFLFQSQRKVMRVGHDVASDKGDDFYYDLLASEARTAVFIAIAKGDIPRESWFHLGRKLTAYRNHRTLVSWSGTMFEYLMPLLHMRRYENTLLDQSLREAVKAQQTFARERRIPWGISEAAFAARDSRMQYQYHAFGIPALCARADISDEVVVAPYATMLALMIDPAAATANLRQLASKGALDDQYGFFESIDYSRSIGINKSEPQIIRSFMVHHQGMGLLAINNAVLNGRMQERFHLDPAVQATEYLLQERMPALMEMIEEEPQTAAA